VRTPIDHRYIRFDAFARSSKDHGRDGTVFAWFVRGPRLFFAVDRSLLHIEARGPELGGKSQLCALDHCQRSACVHYDHPSSDTLR
jgi:hypothetical protein